MSYEDFNLGLNLMAMMLTAMQLILLRRKGFIYKKDGRSPDQMIFNNLVLSIFVALVCINLTIIADGVTTGLFKFINSSAHFIAGVLSVLTTSIWLIFVNYHIYGSYENQRKAFRLYLFPAVINLICHVANFFLGFIYTIDESNIYHRQPYFAIQGIIIILMSIYGLHFIFKEKNRINNRAFPVLVVYELVPIVFCMAEYLLPDYTLIYACFALTTFAVYIVIQSELKYDKDVKAIEKLLDESELAQIYNSLSHVFSSAYDIDYRDMSYKTILGERNPDFEMADSGDIRTVFGDYMSKSLAPDSINNFRRFCDFSTLNTRMHESDILTIEVRNRNGEWRKHSFLASGRDEWGNLLRVMFITRDINDEKTKSLKYINEILIRSEETDATLRRKNEFISRMSHDLRTPVSGINGMAKVARDNAADPEKVRKCLESIETCSSQLNDLIENVIELGTFEYGNAGINEDVFNTKTVTDRCLDMFDEKIREKELSVEILRQEQEGSCVKGDESRICKALIQIVSNAVRFTGRGGAVTVNEEFVRMPAGKTALRYIVNDTGIGISEDFLPHIYEPFAQDPVVKAGRAEVNEGSGLGMTFVKACVDMLDGSIGVESSRGRGTKVTVSFPVEICEGYKAKASETAAEEEEPDYDRLIKTVDLAGKRVLVAEDNYINCKIFETMLQRSGFIVDIEIDGSKALERFKSSKEDYYDFILMDIRMPVMDGIEATRQIRALERNDAGLIPIIAVTANTPFEDEQSVYNAGMNEYIAKPVDFNGLMTKMKRCYLSRNKRVLSKGR